MRLACVVAALAIVTPVTAAPVTWTFTGVITTITVLETGTPPVAVGDTFEGVLYFDTNITGHATYDQMRYWPDSDSYYLWMGAPSWQFSKAVGAITLWSLSYGSGLSFGGGPWADAFSLRLVDNSAPFGAVPLLQLPITPPDLAILTERSITIDKGGWCLYTSGPCFAGWTASGELHSLAAVESSSVPEPGTALLLAAGLVTRLMRRRGLSG